MRTRIAAMAAALLAAATVPTPVSAQPEHERGDPIDRFHTRHTHPHGEPHPVVLDPARFTTSRTSPVDLPLPEEKDAFFFVVYGDRTGGPDEGVSILKDAIRDTNLLEPDLVMTVGDLIQGYNQTDEWLEQMREYKEAMDHLKCPWFPVAGNHDVYWRGPGRPEGEHERNYEMHFGPLWYAFEHKNCWFIALYSDEGDPSTGEKSFRSPAAQRMSDAQFTWLEETLEKASDADHVFVFLHHPRWNAGGYGDDWNDRVHDLLVGSGNVSAVFAGHIHRQTYAEDDGIEYFTLATVGGHQQGTVPEAGFLHHFNVVTVRKGQISHATIPVGEVIDPREHTAELRGAAETLARMTPGFSQELDVAADGSVGRTLLSVTIPNETGFDIDVAVTPFSRDSRWFFAPDHSHTIVPAGGSREMTFAVSRQAAAIDSTFHGVSMQVAADLTTDAFRYSIPTIAADAPMEIDLEAPARPAVEMALRTGEDAYLAVDDGSFVLPDGPFTLEAWLRADGPFGGRTGLVAKTESSDYGIFVSDGRPHFAVHLGGSYRVAESDAPLMDAGRWHHVAGVYDGSEVRVYLDGGLVEATPASGERRTNELPLMIGADVRGNGDPTSFFDGRIDAVRLSTGARYTGSSFRPQRRLEGDAATLLLFNFDGAIAEYVFDEGVRGLRPKLGGSAAVVPADN